MTESLCRLSEIRFALKRKSLASNKYKLQNSTYTDDVSQGYLTLLDTVNGAYVSGKIVTSSNEMNHWPLLNHENVAPLLDVLNIRSDLKIFMTIDIQVKLKDIIHKEDFVYNSRCFERKKAYAKGIFSGLSYIHGKSLCLMNLSDDNIYICSTQDKAVITNFSFISCSKKATRDKLRVPEYYKAPETEKDEFDATAAEMWASGTLMLDLFLAHMLPWAVIDYKPRRVMEMVNNLSLNFLQVANTGSLVTASDFNEFKAFLKCFFKDSRSRITAWLASIASFLVGKFQSEESSKIIFNSNFNCFPQHTENKHSIPAKNSSKSIISKRDTNLSNFLKNDNSNDSGSEEYVYFNETSAEIYLDSENTNWQKSNHSGSSCSNCTKSFSTREVSSNLPLHDFNEKTKGTLKTETNVKEHSAEITCNKQIGLYGEPYYGSEDKECSFSTSKIILSKTPKSCQMIKDEANAFNFKYQQSKSLSFINRGDISCKDPVKISCRKNYLCSLPVRKSNGFDSKSDFCLDRLFENKEESITEKKVSREDRNTDNNRNLHNTFQDCITYEPKSQFIATDIAFEKPETRLSSKDLLSPNSSNKIQRIKERFVTLRKAEVSLKDHKSLFISEELAERQQNIINQYRDLLRQERVRLCEILTNEYMLSSSEVKKLSKSFGSKPRYIKKYNRRSISNNPQFSSSELSDCNLADVRVRGRIARRKLTPNMQKSRDSGDRLKVTPRKRLPYCNKAMGLTADEALKNWNFRIDTRKDTRRNELTLKEEMNKHSNTENGQNTTNRKAKGAGNSQFTKISNCHVLNPSLNDYCKGVTAEEALKNLDFRLKTRKDPERKGLTLTEEINKHSNTKNGQNTTNRKAKGARNSQFTKISNCHVPNQSLKDYRKGVTVEEALKNLDCRLEDPEGKGFALTEKEALHLKAKTGQNTSNRKVNGDREPQVTENSNFHVQNSSVEDSVLKVKVNSEDILSAREERKRSKKDKIPHDTGKTKTRSSVCFSLCCPGGNLGRSYDNLYEYYGFY